jgi:hypothetical protein
MSDAKRDRRGGPGPGARPPHPATVAQPKPAFGGVPARPPHPATMMRGKSAPELPPHPATVQGKATQPASLPAKPPHPATAQRKPASTDRAADRLRDGQGDGWPPARPVGVHAASVQRLRIGPDDLETTNPHNRSAVLAYLRGVGPYQMGQILSGMLAENNRANDEYVQICHMEFARDAALLAIDQAARNARGVWTSAFVLNEKNPWLRTDPARAGEHDEPDSYGIGEGDDDAEMGASVRDSEVATLNAVWRSLVESRHYIQTGHRIDIVVVGNMGPCNGCKIRLRNFLRLLRQNFRYVNFSVEVNYMTRPNDVWRQHMPTTYGDHGDMLRRSPSQVEYYFHQYG